MTQRRQRNVDWCPACFSDFILYDVSSPSPVFVLCMCSFLTRSRGNAHSSSSSICSVNSLWVITSLLQFWNRPTTLLPSLPLLMLTTVSPLCHYVVWIVQKEHGDSSEPTPCDRAASLFQYFHLCFCFVTSVWVLWLTFFLFRPLTYSSV